MPMDCASSCKTFEAFSTSIELIAHNKFGIRYIIPLRIHVCVMKVLNISLLYVIIFGMREIYWTFLQLFLLLALNLASAARLPPLNLISIFMNKKKPTISSLIGKLDFIAGWGFLHRLIYLTSRFSWFD